MDRTGVREVFCEKWVTLLRLGPCMGPRLKPLSPEYDLIIYLKNKIQRKQSSKIQPTTRSLYPFVWG